MPIVVIAHRRVSGAWI